MQNSNCDQQLQNKESYIFGEEIVTEPETRKRSTGYQSDLSKFRSIATPRDKFLNSSQFTNRDGKLVKRILDPFSSITLTDDPDRITKMAKTMRPDADLIPRLFAQSHDGANTRQQFRNTKKLYETMRDGKFNIINTNGVRRGDLEQQSPKQDPAQDL